MAADRIRPKTPSPHADTEAPDAVPLTTDDDGTDDDEGFVGFGGDDELFDLASVAEESFETAARMFGSTVGAVVADALAAWTGVYMRTRLVAANVRLPEKVDVAVSAWVEQLALAMVEYDIDLEVATSVRLQSTLWRAVGALDALLGPAVTSFADLGAEQAPIDHLVELGERTEPEVMGCWLRTRGDGLDAGWLLPVSMPVDELAPMVGSSKSAGLLRGWLEANGVAELTSVERSVGPSGHIGTTFEMPGDDLGARFEAYADLTKHLEIGEAPSVLADALEQTLGEDHAGEMTASAWFGPDGLVRIGLMVPDPPPATLVGLSMVLDVDNDDELARVQGTLGADQPRFAEIVRLGAELDVEVGWEVPMGL